EWGMTPDGIYEMLPTVMKMFKEGVPRELGPKDLLLDSNESWELGPKIYMVQKVEGDVIYISDLSNKGLVGRRYSYEELKDMMYFSFEELERRIASPQQVTSATHLVQEAIQTQAPGMRAIFELFKKEEHEGGISPWSSYSGDHFGIHGNGDQEGEPDFLDIQLWGKEDEAWRIRAGYVTSSWGAFEDFVIEWDRDEGLSVSDINILTEDPTMKLFYEEVDRTLVIVLTNEVVEELRKRGFKDWEGRTKGPLRLAPLGWRILSESEWKAKEQPVNSLVEKAIELAKRYSSESRNRAVEWSLFSEEFKAALDKVFDVEVLEQVEKRIAYLVHEETMVSAFRATLERFKELVKRLGQIKQALSQQVTSAALMQEAIEFLTRTWFLADRKASLEVRSIAPGEKPGTFVMKFNNKTYLDGFLGTIELEATDAVELLESFAKRICKRKSPNSVSEWRNPPKSQFKVTALAHGLALYQDQQYFRFQKGQSQMKP
ncbi:hypothetical protein ACFL28_05580, partial [Candidatus Omnitrophota bacterium]